MILYSRNYFGLDSYFLIFGTVVIAPGSGRLIEDKYLKVKISEIL